MSDYVPIDPAKEKVLGILSLISGFISFCASTWIIVEVVTTQAKLHTVYNRLLLAMSIFDVLSSIGHMMGPLPMSDNEIALAKGNDLTCSAQGFLVQLGIVAPVYHVFLSVYYLLIVKFEVTQDKIINYAEPIMHGTAILFGFGTGIACIALSLFGNVHLWCWITPSQLYYRLGFFYVPLWVSMISVLGINLWIFRTVRRREQRAQKLHAIHNKKHGRRNDRSSVFFSRGRTSMSKSSQISKSPHISFLFGNRPSHIFSTLESKIGQDENKREESTALHSIAEGNVTSVTFQDCDRDHYNTSIPQRVSKIERVNQNRHVSVADQTPRQNVENKPSPDSSGLSRMSSVFTPLRKLQKSHEPSFINKNDDDDQLSHDDKENFFFTQLNTIQKIVLPERSAIRFSRKIQKREESEEFRSVRRSSIESADVKFVLRTVENYPSAARQYAATYHIGARLIFYQSLAYVLLFWTTWLFPTIHQIFIFIKQEQKIYWVLVCQALFEPLQGLFNFSVYRFAHILRLKELHPQWTTRRILLDTVRWTFSKKRSDFAKAKRVDRAKDSIRESGIQSMNIDKEGGLQHSDDDSHDSDSYKSLKDASLSVDNERVIRRMSSLMGDLMTEFADDPDILNQNYTEVIGEDLFSYPTSFLPNASAGQSLSGSPSSTPIVVLMGHFPVRQPFFFKHNGSSNEYNDSKLSVESSEDDAQTSKDRNDPSKENNDTLTMDQSTVDDSQKSKNENADNEVALVERTIMISPESSDEDENGSVGSTGMSEKTSDFKEEKELEH